MKKHKQLISKEINNKNKKITNQKLKPTFRKINN